jgi:hypothetical protein
MEERKTVHTIKRKKSVLIWVTPVCYSKYSDNKHSQHTTVDIYFAHYVIIL